MKKKYESPSAEVQEFDPKDLITTLSRGEFFEESEDPTPGAGVEEITEEVV